jgi:hypothetical protein
MAWTTPRTWTNGETPSAATLNAHIRDNLLAQAIAVTGNFEVPYATGNHALDGLALSTMIAPYLRVVSGLPAWSASPGMIAYKRHNPSTREDYSLSGTTFADIDATDLAVAFTVPPSGAVIVYFAAFAGINTNGTHLDWNLRSGSSDLAGTEIRIGTGDSDGGPGGRLLGQARISGLTPGDSLTYKWGYRLQGTAGSAAMAAGGGAGPALMEVWGA